MLPLAWIRGQLGSLTGCDMGRHIVPFVAALVLAASAICCMREPDAPAVPIGGATVPRGRSPQDVPARVTDVLTAGGFAPAVWHALTTHLNGIVGGGGYDYPWDSLESDL